MMARTSVPDLELSMDAYSLRQKTISDNIANAMTPGYKAKKVEFEEEYKKAADSGSSLKLAQTHSNHIPYNSDSLEQIQPRVTYEKNTLNDSGINNVDVDKEMADLAENNMRYEMSTALIIKKFANIKNAIRGR